jgi:hypothetical protein
VEQHLVLLVHLAPENRVEKTRKKGIRAARMAGEFGNGNRRAVWAFSVFDSYTLTQSWARELKRSGASTLVAVTFRLDDDEDVFARHYNDTPMPMMAAEAAGYIGAADDPRGYAIIVPRSIVPRNVARTKILPTPIGWRHCPDAKNEPLLACDCPMCVPLGEVKARRYRVCVREVIAQRELEGKQAGDDEG